MIDTGKVQGRRALAFENLDAVLADVDTLAAAEAAGKLKKLGNWSLGQACGHVAAWMSYPYDGYPKDIKPPWFIILLMRLKRKDFLAGKLPAGVKIPGIEGGTKGIEPLSTADGVAKLRKAIERLKKAPPTIPNPLFGSLTHEEWMAINRGHAALHLSFFVIE